MRYFQTQVRRLVSRSCIYLGLVMAGFTGLASAGPAVADELESCMTELLLRSSDSTTVGELRSRCTEWMQAEKAMAQDESPPVVVVDRLKEDRENVLQPFTLMAHKPNYFLAGAYNSKGYDPSLFRVQYRDPSIDFDKTEAQFQISLKVPLGVNVFNRFDIYAAYTNRSFWQFYNNNISRPFRETNHEPEVWAQFTPSWEILGFRNIANSIGVVHQSNGQGGVLSRSWNRVFANFVFARGNFAFEFKPWIRISEDASNDDNPDITDYLGHYEIRAGYKWNEQVFSLMSRNNLESGFDRGAVELGWSFPLWNYPYLKGYVQYFRGYGESLIDYNRHVNRIGIGISLIDWL
ncbi:MAG TPA: phospholipase A [Xanthomonadales bacterium]